VSQLTHPFIQHRLAQLFSGKAQKLDGALLFLLVQVQIAWEDKRGDSLGPGLS
jgi:hypothetical protein